MLFMFSRVLHGVVDHTLVVWAENPFIWRTCRSLMWLAVSIRISTMY